mgnify:CR=1 FL=1
MLGYFASIAAATVRLSIAMTKTQCVALSRRFSASMISAGLGGEHLSRSSMNTTSGHFPSSVTRATARLKSCSNCLRKRMRFEARCSCRNLPSPDAKGLTSWLWA